MQDNINQNQHISNEQVRRLTLSVYKITALLNVGDPLRDELRRDCTAFFLGCDALGDKSPGDLADLKKRTDRIVKCLGLIKFLPELKKLNIAVLESSYRHIQDLIPKGQQEPIRHASVAPEDTSRFQYESNVVENEQSKRNVPDTSRSVKEVSMPKVPAPVIIKRVIPMAVQSKETSRKTLSERQQFILKFAVSKGRFQLKDLASHFSSLSEKTIRNDLLVLCEAGLVARYGVAPRSYYQVTNNAVYAENNAESIVTNAEVGMAV